MSRRDNLVMESAGTALANVSGDAVVPRPADSNLMLLGCSACCCLANVSMWLVPQSVNGIVDRFGVGAAAAGLIPSIELALAAVTSIVLSWGAARAISPLGAIVASLVLLATNVAAVFSPSLAALFALRVVSGLMAGVLITRATVPIAGSANPDRGYALINMANSAYGSAVLLAIPFLVPHASGLFYYGYGAMCLLPWLVILLAIAPAQNRVRQAAPVAAVAPARTRISAAAIALFVAVGLTSLLGFVVFTFSIGLGIGLGMTENAVSTTLGVAELAAIGGTFLVAVIAGRSRWLPMVLALGATLVANDVVVTTGMASSFRLGLIFSLVGIAFTLPLWLGYAAKLDPTGRLSGIAMGIFLVASALSPIAGGLFIQLYGLRALSGATVFIFGLAIVLATVVEAAVRARQRSVGPALERSDAPDGGPTQASRSAASGEALG